MTLFRQTSFGQSGSDALDLLGVRSVSRPSLGKPGERFRVSQVYYDCSYKSESTKTFGVVVQDLDKGGNPIGTSKVGKQSFVLRRGAVFKYDGAYYSHDFDGPNLRNTRLTGCVTLRPIKARFLAPTVPNEWQSCRTPLARLYEAKYGQVYVGHLAVQEYMSFDDITPDMKGKENTLRSIMDVWSSNINQYVGGVNYLNCEWQLERAVPRAWNPDLCQDFSCLPVCAQPQVPIPQRVLCAVAAITTTVRYDPTIRETCNARVLQELKKENISLDGSQIVSVQNAVFEVLQRAHVDSMCARLACINKRMPDEDECRQLQLAEMAVTRALRLAEPVVRN